MEKDDDKTRAPDTLIGAFHADTTGTARGSVNVLRNGTRLGEFEIVRLIGEGGFGIVYLAYDHSLERHVALKEYMPAGLASRTADMHVAARSPAAKETFQIGMRSFINEAKLLARFDSPSLVKVFRFWEENGTAYMAMPFYEGMTLKQALKGSKIIPSEEWIKAFLAYLFDAVESIHALRCYHRDIAPDNILLLKDGRPLLLDFGAARRVISDRTQGPTAILKPGFAPIEQYADIPTFKQGPWTDIYALGAVVYYLITGKPPPPAVSRIVSDEMVPAREAGKGRYQESFLRTLDHALAVNPEHRIRTVAQFRDALGIAAEIPNTMPPIRPSASMAEPGHAPFRQTAHADIAETLPLPPHAARHGKAFSAVRSHLVVPARRWLASSPAQPRRAWLAAGALLLAGAIGAAYWGSRAPRSSQADATAPNQSTPVASGMGEPPSPYGGTQAGGASVPEKTAGIQAPAASANPQAAPAASAKSPEDSLWDLTTTLNNATAYQVYLNQYPKGRYSSIARARLDSINAAQEASLARSAAPDAKPGLEMPEMRLPPRAAEAQEDDLWKAVRSIDKPLAYESFLNRYPHGRYSAAARSNLARLTAPRVEPPRVEQQVAQAPTVPPFPGRKQPDRKPEATPAPPAGGVAGLPAPSASPPAPSAPADPSSAPPAPPESIARAERNPPAARDMPAATRPAESGSPVAMARPESPSGPAPETSQALPPPSIAIRSGKSLRVANQTMTGDFTSDPVSGAVSGHGRIVWDNGDQFEGTLVHGVKQGKGEFIWANGQRYKGDWARGLPNGKGTIYFPNGNRYEGDMRDGVPNGMGAIYFSNGNRYRGEVKDGLPHGKGVNRFTNGDVYSGGWSRGKSDGQGRYTWANGNYWEGEFRDDRKTDNGKLVVAGKAAGDAPPAGASVREDIDPTLRETPGRD